MDHDQEITPLLERAHRGDREALEAVSRLVYGDLLGLARKLMYRRYGGKAGALTLEPASLVNETFVKLLRQRNQYKNREHLFAIATKIMMRVLADYNKARNRQKRAGNRVRVSLSALGAKGAVGPETDLPALREALEKLEQSDPRGARIARLRLLWGMNATETAEVLGVSRSTVTRDWEAARKWLAERL